MWERRMWKRIDWWLLLAMGLSQALGLLALASATYTMGWGKLMRQVVWMLLGWGAFAFALRNDFQVWARWAKWIYWVCVGLLVLVLVVGHEQYGAQRWLRIGSITFQPSEFVKAALIISLSAFFAEHWERVLTDFRLFLRTGFLVGLPTVLVFLQPDLGTALVLVSVWLGMLFFIGVPMRWLMLTVLAGCVLFAFVWEKGLIKDYQKQRLIAFLDPYSRATKEGYHILQSQLAIGSGGLTGKGWFQGRIGKLGFVPAQHTDFIFTVIGEEGGFIVSCAVVVLFGVLLWRLLKIMAETENVLPASLVAGTFCFLAIHILVNIGMTLRLMPITGLPLPFYSAGGSNLVVAYLLLGIAQSVAVRRKRLSFG